MGDVRSGEGPVRVEQHLQRPVTTGNRRGVEEGDVSVEKGTQGQRPICVGATWQWRGSEAEKRAKAVSVSTTQAPKDQTTQINPKHEIGPFDRMYFPRKNGQGRFQLFL